MNLFQQEDLANRNTDDSDHWLHTWENRICNAGWIVLAVLLGWIWVSAA